jgi:hypothetical protein
MTARRDRSRALARQVEGLDELHLDDDEPAGRAVAVRCPSAGPSSPGPGSEGRTPTTGTGR